MPKQSRGTWFEKGHCTSGAQTAQVCGTGQHIAVAAGSIPLARWGLWNCTAGLERYWKGAINAIFGEMLPGSPDCLSPLLHVSPSEMLSYSCPLSWRVKVKRQQGLSALHLLSPSCPGKSTAQPRGSHPSFPVSLLGSVPQHPPRQEEGKQELPICSGGCCRGPGSAPGPWGPSPPRGSGGSRCPGK